MAAAVGSLLRLSTPRKVVLLIIAKKINDKKKCYS